MIISPDTIIIEQQGSYAWTPAAAEQAWTSAQIRIGRWAAGQIHDNKRSAVLLLCGPSHSGKSTAGAGVVNNYELVIDATFTNRRSRSALVCLLTGMGFPVHIMVVRTPLEVCLERLAAGQAAGDEKSLVITPDVIRRQFDQFEMPTSDEGFARIFQKWFQPPNFESR